MQVKSAEFLVSNTDLDKCPRPDKPEYAFIGRSNVGKSSLINMLVSRHGLAKTSGTPGKTQLVNHFLINKEWYLVDLPGYGYAKVAKSEKINFNESVGDYIEQRENLRLVFVLIDSRLPPQPIDLNFISWIAGCAVPFVLVFTKADKQSLGKTQATIAAFQESISPHVMSPPPVIISSSKTRDGRIGILKAIEQSLQE